MIFTVILNFPFCPCKLHSHFWFIPHACMGKVSCLSKNHQNSDQISFYVSVPCICLTYYMVKIQIKSGLTRAYMISESLKWPVLAIAILALVAGSKAIISGTFSIINQSRSLGCFPSQSCAFLRQDSWLNLHSRDQLDAHDPMYCCHYRFPRHQNTWEIHQDWR